MGGKHIVPIILNTDGKRTIGELIAMAKERLIEALKLDKFIEDIDYEGTVSDYFDKTFLVSAYAHVWVEEIGSWEKVTVPEAYQKVLLIFTEAYVVPFILKPEPEPNKPVLYIGHSGEI